MFQKLFQKLFLIQLAFLISGIATVFAEDNDIDALGFLNKPQDQIVSTSRSPRPISKSAENITVITAADIERLNAHTLDEVLQTVSGIQFLQMRTPGSATMFSINGALSSQVLVLIDDVPQNILGVDDSPDVGMIPVQRIARIEIIKGAASTAWGPALGGAINIITRDPEQSSTFQGIASSSYGGHGTSDLRGGVSGTTGRLGYYLDGGRYSSSGLLPGNPVTLDQTFVKLTYNLPGKGRLAFSADYRNKDFGYGYDDSAIGAGDTLITGGSRNESAYLRFDYQFYNQLSFEFLSAIGQKNVWRKYTQPGDILVLDAKNRTDSRQLSAKLTWSGNKANFVTGIEYLNDTISESEPVYGFSYMNFNRNLDRYGAFLDGSFSCGPVTLLSGVRSDNIGVNKQVTSYHLGATVPLTEKTLFRVNAVRGYSLPMPNFHDSLQNILTWQSGIETNDIPFIWLKGNFFYSNTWNIESFVVPVDYPSSPVGTYQTEEVRRGFEIEARTIPLYDLSLASAFAYSDVRDKNTDARIKQVPISTTKLSIKYEKPASGLQAMLVGSFVNWPSDAGNSVHDKSIVWDLHLLQKFPEHGGIASELFISGHNLFNNAQYVDDYRKNALRWFDGGIRVKF